MRTFRPASAAEPRRRPNATVGSLSALAAFGLALAVACGGPKYPSCDNDQHCTADGHKGVCVMNKCVECRENAQCGAGKACKGGRCEGADGFCDDKTPCPGGVPCQNHKCADGATASGAPVECDDDHPCKGSGEKCQNGHCVGPEPGGPGCRDFTAPKFNFESAELTDESKATLQRLAECMNKGSLKGRRVLLTGHCDNRGEYEFNMSLGAERAEVTKTFLSGLGLPTDRITTSSRGKLDAVGTDEAGWSRDRRVDIEVR